MKNQLLMAIEIVIFISYVGNTKHVKIVKQLTTNCI